MKQLMFKSLTQTFRPLQPRLALSSFMAPSQFSYRTAVRREKNKQFEHELHEYNQKMGEMRNQHRKDYWEVQTQVENSYLLTWQKEQTERQKRDLDKWRTSICKIAMHTKKQLSDLDKREKRLLETMRSQDLKNSKKALENKMMLDAMQIDSRRWPTPFDLNEKIDDNVILPQTILNYGEYQQKLQNLAFYAEQGDHESMQKLLDKEDVMERKNMFLQPIFRDLKSMIKHMSHTEEYKILKEYIDNRNAILTQYPAESARAQKGTKMLEQEYAKLLNQHHHALRNEPSKRLKLLQKRLEDLFQLLNLWTQYVEVIYMPESEIHVLSTIEKMQARPEESSYNFRAQEEDVKRRINTLFGKDDDSVLTAQKKEGEEDYETVNEGLTSDTTEAPLHQSKRTSVDDYDDKSAHTPMDNDGEEATGILSSDEEDSASQEKYHKTEKIIRQQKVMDKPMHHEEIKSFTQSNQTDKIFESEKAKEEVENKFNYAENDLEQYSAKLQTKAERDRVRSADYEREKLEEGDQAFVKKSQYNAQDLEKLDMHAMNLFGLPLDEQDKDSETISSSETKQILKDLLEITEQLDDSVNNFGVRKSFVYYDPYDPDQSVTYAYLKFEDQQKLRASIVLDYYRKEIEALQDENLTYADKERKQQVKHLLEYLSQLKVVDAQILMKLYDLYRYRV